MLASLYLAAFAAVTLASPVVERATAPTVTIKNGTVVGAQSNGVDSFQGIPYAQPPVGDLRLRRPQTITTTFGTIQATSSPTACPQFLQQINSDNLLGDVLTAIVNLPIFQTASNTGEDCLTMSVWRPSGTTEGDDLPVVFWIFGGGFELGSTAMYSGESIVQQSVDLGAPMIFVSVNYRVGGFGFLAGEELTAEGNTNLGLRDQRLGLQWAAENVKAFGGDPSKVTIWGESAGSISVFDQLIINGGDNTYNGAPLFRGAIMNSGSVTPADNTSAPQAQTVYDAVVKGAGCDTASDTLACLRQVDYGVMLDATANVPGLFSYRSLDLSYLPRPDSGDNFFPVSPEVAVDYAARVPLIIGDQEDEGTLFSQVTNNISTNAQLVDYFASYFPGNPNAHSLVNGLASLYPDILPGQPDGSPFRTGTQNNIYPQYKRVAAILGDITFTLTRRVFLELLRDTTPTWSYLNTFFSGNGSGHTLGTYHGSDILFSFGEAGDNQPLTNTLQTFWIGFVNALDPNHLINSTANPGIVAWPQWTSNNPVLLNVSSGDTSSVIADDFRASAAQYLANHTSEFRV